MKTSHLLALAALLAAASLPAQAQITPGTRTSTVDEQASLDLINRFRADPQGELARMLNTSQATLWAGVDNSTNHSAGFWAARAGAGAGSVAFAMDYFQVDPSDLKNQWSALPTAGSLHPLSWNATLGHSSLEYAKLVVADNGVNNPHYVPPYQQPKPLNDRFEDAGYSGWSGLGENIARNFTNSVSYMHAGFAVDWGSTPNGIQDPSGHRNSMLSEDFAEIGIGIWPGYGAGNVTQVQHFGNRNENTAEYVWGYAWADGDASSAYTFGEGASGLTVELRDGSNNLLRTASTDANGAYAMEVASLANGTYTVQFRDGATLLGSDTVTFAADGLNLYNVGFQVTAVPEPETYAMLLAGLGMLGFMSRRRTLHDPSC
jgi:5-hydroxyisourate hydrolase-like protein (transthyretin family)